MKLWSLLCLLTAGLLTQPAVSRTTPWSSPSTLGRVVPFWGGAEFLAMSACAEFPSQPNLAEPPQDTGRDTTGQVPGSDAGDDGAPPDVADRRDDIGPDGGDVADDGPALVSDEAGIADLDDEQIRSFCAALDAQVGLPAAAQECEGRSVWPTAIDCPVTVSRLGECGVTVGDYADCLALAVANPCSLLYAPVCEDIHRCLGTGLDPATSIRALPAEDYGRMCRWGVEGLGENREFFCDGIIRINTHTVEDCEAHDRSGCEVTVREYEACTRHIRDDICEVLNAPVCAPFRACFGPNL